MDNNEKISQAILEAYRVIEHVGAQVTALWDVLERELLRQNYQRDGFTFRIEGLHKLEEANDANGYIHRAEVKNYSVSIRAKDKKGPFSKAVCLGIQVVLAPNVPSEDKDFKPHLSLLTKEFCKDDFWKVDHYDSQRKPHLSPLREKTGILLTKAKKPLTSRFMRPRLCISPRLKRFVSLSIRFWK